VKEGSKARKEEEAKGRTKGIGISHDPLGNPFTYSIKAITALKAYNKASCLDASHDLLWSIGFGFRNAQQLYP
jgi:hypothetical protein